MTNAESRDIDIRNAVGLLCDALGFIGDTADVRELREAIGKAIRTGEEYSR